MELLEVLVWSCSEYRLRERKKKGHDFRFMRPLILICNDVYHPALPPLRWSSLAEIIHIRKPPLDAVVTRMKSVFEKEGVVCDSDAVRRLCEATWGVNAMESRRGKALEKATFGG